MYVSNPLDEQAWFIVCFLVQGKDLHESDLPKWMYELRSKLQDSRTSRNVKLFICKLIVNTQQVSSIEYQYMAMYKCCIHPDYVCASSKQHAN